MNNNSEIVLITGGAGFVGQHIVREIQLKQSSVCKIRILDLKPYRNCLNVKGAIPVESIIGDIKDRSSMEEAFRGVTCVIHCAAYVSYEYPPNKDILHKNNVEGTQNVISLCKEHDVTRLVFTSSAEVAMVPYLGSTCITIIVNQTERRALPPAKGGRFTIPGYAASKFQSEQIVLEANGSTTKSGLKLKTVALRPPFIYGEEDPNFITSLINIAHSMGGKLPRIAGTGGKQQTVYAGNVAWGHVCALETLLKETEEISGMPVFITDDTTVADTTRLCERLTRVSKNKKPLCQQTWWSIPLLLSMLLALVAQSVSSITAIRLPVSPCALISYLGSFILFSRLRAAIHMGYTPKYSEDDAVQLSAKFYVNHYKILDEKKTN